MGSRKNIQHRAGGGDVKVNILIFMMIMMMMQHIVGGEDIKAVKMINVMKITTNNDGFSSISFVLFRSSMILICIFFRFSTRKLRWSAKARCAIFI